MKSFWTIPLCLCIALVFARPGAAAAPPDDSSPKAAAKSLYLALAAGDVETAKQVAIIADPWQEAFKTLVDYGLAFTRVSDAIESQFGKDAANTMPSPGKRAALIDGAMESIQGDTAMVTPADGNDPMHLKRIDGHWKVDVFANPALKDPDTMVRAMKAMEDAANKTADDAKAGKFKTLQDLQKGLVDRITHALPTPATAPAAGPTTR